MASVALDGTRVLVGSSTFECELATGLLWARFLYAPTHRAQTVANLTASLKSFRQRHEAVCAEFRGAEFDAVQHALARGVQHGMVAWHEVRSVVFLEPLGFRDTHETYFASLRLSMDLKHKLVYAAQMLLLR